MADCLFCKIVDGSIPAKIVHRDQHVVAFRDIQPQAPVHVLVIPTRHVVSVEELGDDDGGIVARLFLVARDLARTEAVAEGGYRLVMNTGKNGGQSVFHMHLHLLGGRPMGWPPG